MMPIISTRCFASSSRRGWQWRPGDGGDDIGLGALARLTSVERSAAFSGGDHLDHVEPRIGRFLRGEKALRLRLAEEVVGVHHHHALRAHPGFLEDVGHEADGVSPKVALPGKMPVHVLDLLLPFADGLGDVRGGLVGRGDVDDEGDTPLLRRGAMVATCAE